MATHRVYANKGAQALYSIPHRDGRPVRVTGATYAIYNARHSDGSSAYETVPKGTVAVVDPYSGTLTAIAGRNGESRREVHLGSTAGLLAGHTYILTSTSGHPELAKIVAVPTAQLALTHSEIRGDFPIGSTLKGVECAALFPGAEADDSQHLGDGFPWILEWHFAGIASPIRESIHLERGEENQLATLQDLLELHPGLSIQGGDRVDAAHALSRAHKDFRLDIMLAGAQESDLLTGPLGVSAVVYRAAQIALQTSESDNDRALAESYGQRYQELRTALQVGANKPQVVNLDPTHGHAKPTNPAQLFKGFGW